jgi:hypothetical protein
VCVNHGGHVIFWTNAPLLKANGGNAPCLCGGPLVHYCNSGGGISFRIVCMSMQTLRATDTVSDFLFVI